MNVLVILISLFFQEGTFEIINDDGESIASSAVNNGSGEYTIGSSDFLTVSTSTEATIEYFEITHVRKGMGIESKKSKDKIDMSYFNENLTIKDALAIKVKVLDGNGKSKVLYYVLKAKKSD